MGITPLDFKYIEHLLLDQTGNTFGILDKSKLLRKFGHTVNADAGVRTTIATFQGSVVNETYATGNTIDHIVSDNAADTGLITVEGHTLDPITGDRAFAVQTVSLTGTTAAPLSTPLFRCTRLYRTDGTFASPSVLLVGNVYAFDSTLAGGSPGGTPSNATATKCMIEAGEQNSSKCATSTSATDAWVITHLHAGIERTSGSGAHADAHLEVRYQGGVYRNVGGEITLSTAAMPFAEVSYETPIIIPPNSDVRMIGISDTNNTSMFAEIDGFLAKQTGINGL